jgi:hypothetical protein
MTTFYRGHLALVTHEVFESWSPCRQRFLLRHLSEVGVVRCVPDLCGLGLTWLAWPTAMAFAASWPFLHSPLAWATALAVAAMPAVVGGAWWYRRPPAWELVAAYGGYQVRLFVTPDKRIFGQVRRALLRAMEANARA